MKVNFLSVKGLRLEGIQAINTSDSISYHSEDNSEAVKIYRQEKQIANLLDSTDIEKCSFTKKLGKKLIFYKLDYSSKS